MKLKNNLVNHWVPFAFTFISVLFFSWASSAATEQVYIKVGNANIKRSLLALPAFQFMGNPKVNKSYVRVGKELYNTVRNDLDVSSYFRFIRDNAYLEDPNKTGLRPKSKSNTGGFSFDNWKPLATEFLIRVGYNILGDKVTMESYLYHIPSAKPIFGKKYETTSDGLRKMAHSFSNDILQSLTGKKGMFDSRVVVVSANSDSRHKEIYIMDWDGKNKQPISQHKSITISPAWSPDNTKVAYTAYRFHTKLKTRNQDMLLFDLASGKRSVISQRKGINSGAAFIPGSDELLMTISIKGNPDIYRVTRDGKIKERLTRGPAGAMNVEPVVSPDGRKIAFSSDRSGKPMIYVMDLAKPKTGSRKAKRVVFAGKYNSTPSWSPDGQRLAFAGFDAELKHFDIFSMKADGTDLIRLTTARKVNGKYSNNEAPSFSPDGRHVMFISDRTGRKQVYIVNADGSNERRITFDRNDYYKPKWSYPND